MIKSFTQAVKYLERFIPTPDKKHPGSLGLERMEQLVSLLGDPHLTYPTIHVGGTSGKGSTATIIASILATKYKVGLHTSPHLVKINERIITMKQWNNKTVKREIPDKEFVKLLNEIHPAINKVEESLLGKPSYFEIVTAMAFLYFKKQKVDLAVIEVGMGGRFDATNVIKPIVAVLTNVGLDHTEILGDTVEKIATDKAGIIKPGIKVVTGIRQPSVIEIIETAGSRQQAEVSILNRDFSYQVKKTDEKGNVFDYFGDHTYKNLKISLLGVHQVENAVLAIRAIELLCASAEVSSMNLRILRQAQDKPSFRIGVYPERSRRAQKASLPADLSYYIRKGLKQAFIPGRMEIVHKRPTVILDGAHNPDKMKALVTAIRTIYPKKPVISIVAIKEDKKSEEMLAQILKISKRVVFTKFQLTADTGIIKSYDPNELLKMARSIEKTMPLSVISDAKDAVEKTIKSAKEDDIILVTGSLYLVGEVRKFLK